MEYMFNFQFEGMISRNRSNRSAIGNVLLGYARLNVKGGLRKLFEGPLTDAHFAAPALAALSRDIDVRRAVYDSERRMLALTLQPIEGPVDATLSFDNALADGMPTIAHDAKGEIRLGVDGRRLELRLPVARRTTMVLSW